MSNATITGFTRRFFDLPREVFAVRCSSCPWPGTEVRTVYLAEAIRARHECQQEEA